MTRRTRLRTILVIGLVVLSAVGAVAGPAAAVSGAHDASNCSFPVTVTDATGTTVTVDQAPQTVVTLGPSAAQTMWEIGAQDKVVGLTKYASYLNGSASRTNVSGAGRTAVVTEKVVNLQPDLVLAPNIIPNRTVAKLRSAGLTVVRFHAAKSMTDIENKTRLIGRLTGTCAGATDRVGRMQRTLDLVHRAVNGTDRPKVLYYMSGGYTAGTGTFIDTIVSTAGGTNVAAEAGISGYGEVSPEVVVTRNPQWIIRSSEGVALPKTKAYNGTAAVQSGHVITLNPNYVSEPAPRTIQVVATLAKTLHPKAYAQASAGTTNRSTTTAATGSNTTTTTAAPSTTTTSSPGFGVLAALLALGLFAVGGRLR